MKSYLENAVAAELSSAHLRAKGPIVQATIYGPNGQSVTGNAMIDTGADSTAVDYNAMVELGLEPTGSMYAQGVTSDGITIPTYALRMSFPGSGFPDAEFDRVAATPHLGPLNLLVLVGRDVLNDAKFAYDGPTGRFAFGAAESGADLLLVEPSGPPLKALALGLVFAGAIGFMVYKLKPEPPCPPCDAAKGV